MPVNFLSWKSHVVPCVTARWACALLPAIQENRSAALLIGVSPEDARPPKRRSYKLERPGFYPWPFTLAAHGKPSMWGFTAKSSPDLLGNSLSKGGLSPDPVTQGLDHRHVIQGGQITKVFRLTLRDLAQEAADNLA